MRSALALQQTALLDALHLSATDLIANYADSMLAESRFGLKNKPSTLRGLRAYRANAQALAGAALQASYPVLRQLLGQENFSHLAQDFWQALPPERGDLAQWGAALPAYLSQVPQLQALLQVHAYLPDVARLEWALHRAATATDAALDEPSFQLLTSCDPSQLRLQLAPGCTVLRSAYPVVALVQWHDAGQSPADEAALQSTGQSTGQGTGLTTLESAREAIEKQTPQTALVWRKGHRPSVAAADEAAATLIEATLQGLSLATALDAALDAALASAAHFDFSAWLTESATSGLLIGVCKHPRIPAVTAPPA